MLLQRNFLVLIAVEAIENMKAGVKQGEKGRLVQSIKNSYPVFFGWVDYGEGRGGEGMVRGGQINRNLN